MKKLLSLLTIGLSVSCIYAGGYRVSTQGQRALAMGHTGVAVVNSAELAFFNPAGLVFLENKLNVSAGVTGILSNVKYQNLSTRESAETDSGISTPFNLYAAYKVNDWLSVALAAYTPYGSKVVWDKDWAGSDLVNEIDLKSIYVSLLASIKLTEHFSIGGGPIYVNGGVDFERNLQREAGNPETRPSISLSADGVTAWGWNAAMMFRPSEKVTIGLNYRSKIDIEAKNGDVTFTDASSLTATKFSATLPLPAELTFGASVQVTKKLLLAAEYNRAYWSVYKSLDLTFNGTPNQSTNTRNYQNSNIYRIGAQYNLNDKFTLRAGYYYDETPVTSGFFAPETPRNDSNNFTTGLSYNINSRLAIDASFAFLHFDEITESYDSLPNDGISPFRGTYKTNTFLGGLGITYKL